MRATDGRNGMRRSGDAMEAGSMEQPGGMPTGGMEVGAGSQMAGGREERAAMGGMRVMVAATDGSGGGGGRMGGAQGQPPRRRTCGTMDVHRRLLSTIPEYAARRAAIESHALAFKRGVRASARLGVVRIPIVTHVVWNAANQNVSDAQIQ